RDGHIRGADHALSPGSRGPMQHRSAREVPAATDQRDPLLQLESLALPELDAAMRLPHPFAIVGVEIDRYAPKRLAPVDKRRVEVWMRNGDCAQSAKPVDQRDRGVIDQRDAIPQDISVRRTQEQCALTDGELRGCADADEAWLVLSESIVVR